MTFDPASPLGRPPSPERSRNGRTPSFDLDSVYGGGPVGSPQLYDPVDRAKLKVESGGLFEDVPRMPDGTAIIADPRNDEHVIIAGLQAAFLRFHNGVVDRMRAGGTSDQAEAYSQARRLTTWHYQWLILHEFLPLFVGQPMVRRSCAAGRRFYRPRKGEAFIPVEFQAAAYRFGHSMVRPSYRANLAGDDGKPFFGIIFDPKAAPDPTISAAGFGRPAPLHRLADVLRLRRRPGEAEQAHRHADLVAALRPPDRRDRDPLRPTALPVGRCSGK